MNIRIARQHSETLKDIAVDLDALLFEFSWEQEDAKDRIEEMQFMCAEIQRETSRLSSRIPYCEADDESNKPPPKLADEPPKRPRPKQVVGYDNTEDFDY